MATVLELPTGMPRSSSSQVGAAAAAAGVTATHDSIRPIPDYHHLAGRPSPPLPPKGRRHHRPKQRLEVGSGINLTKPAGQGNNIKAMTWRLPTSFDQMSRLPQWQGEPGKTHRETQSLMKLCGLGVNHSKPIWQVGQHSPKYLLPFDRSLVWADIHKNRIRAGSL